MKLYLYLLGLLAFALVTSCGGDDETSEPDTPPIMESASASFDGAALNITGMSGKIVDSNVGGWGIRNLELILATQDQGVLTLGVQNVQLQSPGICVRNGVYQFTAPNSECRLIDGDAYCNEAKVRYVDASGGNWISRLNVGTLEVTDCDIDSSRISGQFSGMINKTGFSEKLQIEGTFENLIIAK